MIGLGQGYLPQGFVLFAANHPTEIFRAMMILMKNLKINPGSLTRGRLLEKTTPLPGKGNRTSIKKRKHLPKHGRYPSKHSF